MAFSFATSLRHIQVSLTASETQIAGGNTAAAAAELRRLVPVVEAFEASPSELDALLPDIVAKIARIYLVCKETAADGDTLPAVTAVAYTLAKIRGYKVVANHFASDVYLLPKITGFLGHARPDHERHLLALWMCRLVLVPFPLDSIAGGLAENVVETAGRVLYAGAGTQSHRLASVLLSKVLSRPDCGHFRQNYLKGVFDNWLYSQEAARRSDLMVLNQMLKRDGSLAPSELAELCELLVSESSRMRHDASYHTASTTRVALAKVVAKTARHMVAQQRWQQAADLVNVLLRFLDSEIETGLRECVAKSLAKVTEGLFERAHNYACQLVEFILAGLTGVSTDLTDSIAEAASKGKKDQDCEEDGQNGEKDGQNCEEDGQNYGSDEQNDQNCAEACLRNSLVARFSLPRYHTVLLYVGFLSLSRNLPGLFAPSLLRVLSETLFFSHQRYSFVGSTQLRDSSCFCAWAMFRQFSTEALLGHFEPVHRLFFALVQVAIFDDDYMIRRCAISCLQEFIGRHGAVFFARIRKMRGTKNPENESSDVECTKTESFATATENEAEGAEDNRTNATIGFDVTIRLVELFSFSAVSTLAGSHSLLAPVVALGFPKSVFFAPLLDELLVDSPFEAKKLAACHLKGLLSASSPELYSVPVLKHPAIKTNLVRHHQLYALAEIRPFLSASEVKVIQDHVSSLDFSIHGFDASAQGESVLHWLNSSPSGIDFRLHFPLVLKISRLAWTSALAGEFSRFFQDVQLENAVFSEICSEISSFGNENLGSAVLHAALSTSQYSKVFELVKNPRVDAETRAEILRNFRYTSADQPTRLEYHSTLAALLDDYTLSNRGDVGSHIRLAALHALHQHHEALDSALARSVLLKSLRISGEQMDKLRVSALSLVDGIQHTPGRGRLDSESTQSYEAYFTRLFAVLGQFADETVHKAFWEGIVHSAGAATGPNNLINVSFRHVAKYLASNGPAVQHLVGLLAMSGKFTSLSHRRQKTVVHALTLLGRLWDSGMAPEYDLSALYVRVYNLHINTSSTGRIALVIRVFSHIGAAPTAAGVKARRRLLWLHENHPSHRVRHLALEAMFDIASESGSEATCHQLATGDTRLFKEATQEQL